MSRFNWELGTDPQKDGWLVVLSAHLYYNGNDEEQSKLSDEEFDALKNICLIHWNELDEHVKRILISPEQAKASTMYINLSRAYLMLARFNIEGD